MKLRVLRWCWMLLLVMLMVLRLSWLLLLVINIWTWQIEIRLRSHQSGPGWVHLNENMMIRPLCAESEIIVLI